MLEGDSIQSISVGNNIDNVCTITKFRCSGDTIVIIRNTIVTIRNNHVMRERRKYVLRTFNAILLHRESLNTCFQKVVIFVAQNRMAEQF